ncbi:MAG: phosphoribosyltransferase [Christensenellaceae bacterium]|jgi:hypothetical protein|nr:phosphoribosyltransferase [Christensenellaceae bacterium]
MALLTFQQVFSGDFLTKVTKYSERIQTIINNYDIVIFMARKAVCFYKSMIINKVIIPNNNCRVTSNRIIGYNVLEELKGKRIAVIDDVVVKGESIGRVAKTLEHLSISADYYVLACKIDFVESVFLEDVKLQKTYAYYEESEIYELAKLITQYIEASMCPFNIDQPIFDVSDYAKLLRKRLGDVGAFDITSGLQRKFGISSFVVYFDYQAEGGQIELQSVLQQSLIKIRLLFSDTQVIAMPFVLMPELEISLVEALYKIIYNEKLNKFVANKNPKVESENKLKVLSYYLSEVLFYYYAQSNDLFKRVKLDSNDFIQFNCKTNDMFGEHIKKNDYLLTFLNCVPIIMEFSRFAFTNIVASFYDTVRKIDHSVQEYEDSIGNIINQRGGENGDKLNKIIIPIEDVIANIPVNDEYQKRYFASTLIDIFIDRGMIVPSLVHRDNKIVHAYKMGECSKLEQEQLDVFAFILKTYQELIEREIYKTEFEKLCVLIFNIALKERVNGFQEQTEFSEDCYSIGYSLFGPRVSQGGVTYRVNSDSALITNFCNNGIIESYKGKYYLPHEIPLKNKNLEPFCLLLAGDFAAISKVYLNKNGVQNKYVHTLNQYLTLAAIGDNQKNQFLSLCAELYQLTQLNDSLLFGTAQDHEFTKNHFILHGIDSGLWKYICYKENALEKTEKQMFTLDRDSVRIAVRTKTPIDRNQRISDLIHEVGTLLFRAAFFLNGVIQSNDSKVSYVIDEDIGHNGIIDKAVDKNSRNTMIFGSYYREKSFEDVRKLIEAEQTNKLKTLTSNDYKKWISQKLFEYKGDAQFYLDLCDLYLETDNPNYKKCNCLLIAYSDNGELPALIDGIEEITFAGVSDGRRCKTFQIEDKTKNFVIEQVVNATWKIPDVRYITFKTYYDADGAIQISSKAKGSLLKRILATVIQNVKQEPRNSTKELIAYSSADITPKENFSINCYNFILVASEHMLLDNRKAKYTKTKYSIIKKEKSKMGGKNEFNIMSSGIVQVNVVDTEKAEQKVIQNDDSNKYSIANEFFCKQLLQDLALLKVKLSEIDPSETDAVKAVIAESETALAEKDENRLKAALKRIADVSKDLIISTSGSFLAQYLTYFGYLPR